MASIRTSNNPSQMLKMNARSIQWRIDWDGSPGSGEEPMKEWLPNGPRPFAAPFERKDMIASIGMRIELPRIASRTLVAFDFAFLRLSALAQES